MLRSLFASMVMMLLATGAYAEEVTVAIGATIPYSGLVCLSKPDIDTIWEAQLHSYQEAKQVVERLSTEYANQSDLERCFRIVPAQFIIRWLSPEEVLRDEGAATMRCKKAALELIGVNTIVFAALCTENTEED